MKQHFLTAFCAAAIMAAIGCQNTVNTVENADKHMTPNVIRDARFVTDGFLRDRLALTRIVTSQTADGLMQAQVEAINVRTGVWDQFWSSATNENPYKIRYKFTWFSGDGMAVETILSDWQDITVIPGETVYLRSVAPNKDCKDFKVSLREAQ
ncbi:MAG: DUF1425 domain-containing protein [Lentisphaerae bacterium]|nr:DUF1425 domain-containing protein [Lentisphaerota bacterium]